MMWLLRNDVKGLMYKVTPGKKHLISRKEGDLLLEGDQSISRKHAQLFIDDENENEGIVVKDLHSKFGTFTVAGEGDLTRLSPNQQVILRNGDFVKFGIQWNSWRAEFVPLLVATSTLTQEEKTNVKQMVTLLGGEVVSDWEDKCTHLTMNKLTVTVKVVCALASGQPIVTPGYWQSFTESLFSMQATLPDCKDFVPPLAEAMLNPNVVSFTPNKARSKLFSGCTFVAATAKQLTRIRPMITAAGGNAVEFSTATWSKDKLMEDKTILMQHTASDRQGSQVSQIPDGYIIVARKLRAQGVRCIPESEIGYSVVYCSMVQYCNPHFSAQSLLTCKSAEPSQCVTIICPDSQESRISQNAKKASPGPSNKTTSKKRPHEELGDDEMLASKKPNERIHSEDLFASHNLNSKIPKSLDEISLKKPLLVNDSLNVPKEKVSSDMPVASLDMFAPSGKRPSNANIESELRPPSCQDLFGSTGNKQLHLRELNDNDEFPFAMNKKSSKPVEKRTNAGDEFTFSSNKNSNKQQKRVADESDEFTFLSNKRPNIPQGTVPKETDEFSFASSKRTNKPQTRVANETDEFSFASSKTTNKPRARVANKTDEFSFVSSRRTNKPQASVANGTDEFSFVSSKRPNRPQDIIEDTFSFTSSKSLSKRNREGNTDVFASDAESSMNNSDPIAGPSKVRKLNEDEFSFVQRKQNIPKDNLFAFPGGHKPTRKGNESSINLDEPDSEVKIALFSKVIDTVSDNSGLQTEVESQKIMDPPEEKNLITYSKFMPTLSNVKEEIADGEVDELAKEFENATIIVVVPLVIAKQKPVEASSTSNIKNFKKFRKVVGINKRIVPHIIGGSDLVPYFEGCQPTE